jgi:hypothetical protein
MLIHIANLIILASFLVSDVMWLRALSILGGGVWICYFSFTFTEVNWSGIGWNILFTAINMYYIAQLILDRRPISFTENERSVKYLIAPDLSPREWSKLLKRGEVITGEELTLKEEGISDSVLLVMTGQLTLSSEQEGTIKLSAGELFGGVSFLTGSIWSHEVQSSAEASLVSWKREALSKYLSNTPSVEAIFQRLFGDELARRKSSNTI